MKNLRYIPGCRFYGSVIAFALVCLHTSFAYSVTDFSLSGEFNLLTTWKQLPSRDQGLIGVSVPSIRLDLEMPLRDGNEVYVELETTQFRDATSKRYDTQAKEAYLSLTSLFSGAELRYGLVPNPWVELQRASWDYDFWGPSSELFLIRYGYSSWADLGFVFQGEFADDWGEWTLSAVNGEGAEKEEVGRHKEYMLMLSLEKAAPFYMTLGFLQGAYDGMDDSFSEKKRLMVELSYANEKSFASLTYYDLWDPADAINNGKLVAGVDVLPLLGTNVEGQAVSFLTRRRVTARTELFARADWLNPVKKQSDKTMQAYAAGVSFQSNEDLLWVLGLESATYGSNFASAARDEMQVLGATQVRF